MYRRYLILFYITALICCRSTLAQSTGLKNDSGQTADFAQPTPNQLYDQAKFYYNLVQSTESLSQSRESWLNGARNFRKIYLLTPQSELAPSCLFMLGRMYRQMYEKFKLGIDLDESLSHFNDLVRLFPGHRLADDAHLAIGLIYLQIKQNPQKAADSFTIVVNRFPDGDMRPEAVERLKLLSKDFDIPLPKILIDNSQSEELSTILPVKYWSSKDYTRIVVMAAGPINYKETLLEQGANQPRSLYIDFKNSYIAPQYRVPVTINTGLLKYIHTEQYSADTVRVKLNIESIDSYKIFSLPEPFRVVIDIRGERNALPIATKKAVISSPEILAESESIAHKNAPENAETTEQTKTITIRNDKQKRTITQKRISVVEETRGSSAKQPISLAQQLGLRVKKIVLDPGHGGKDPGAIANNMQEKDIVLKVAQKLKPVLQKELGCEVILTRNKDVFLPLEERTAIANTQEADLFISLHINAHPSSKVRGTETYFLNLSTNAEAMRVAAMENATSTHQMSDLEDILSDILKNSKIDESSRLAQHVQNSILSGMDQKLFGEMKNLGVKQAPFYVLIGAEMPAVLLEIAFISNEDDVKNLQNPKYIDSLTREIAQGIKAYTQTNTASL